MALVTQPIVETLRTISLNARRSLTIFAPYVTVSALKHVLDGSPAQTVDVITTWKSADIMLGISDAKIYPLVTRRGGTIRLLPGLHMKAVIADFKTMFVGSANITSPGIGIGGTSNVECGVVCRVQNRDEIWLRSLLNQSYIVTETAYSAFLKHLAAYSASVGSTCDNEFEWSQWSTSATHGPTFPQLPNPDVLIRHWQNLANANWRSSLDRRIQHDLKLLSLNGAAPSDIGAARLSVRRGFVSLPLAQEFFNFVSIERYFGAIRRWVRQRLAADESIDIVNDTTRRLLAWTVALCPQYRVDRPNYSSRLYRMRE